MRKKALLMRRSALLRRETRQFFHGHLIVCFLKLGPLLPLLVTLQMPDFRRCHAERHNRRKRASKLRHSSRTVDVANLDRSILFD